MNPNSAFQRQYTANAGLKFWSSDTGNMPKSDREEAVLALLAEIGEPLPPSVIYRILRLRGATFARRSVERYCSELSERGDLEKIDPESMEEGNLVAAPNDSKGYWLISEQGRDRIND